jgi:diaminopimelate epimerase
MVLAAAFSYIPPKPEMNGIFEGSSLLSDMNLAGPAAHHPLAGREIVRMNGAGNAILVLDLRGAGVAATPADARAFNRVTWLGYDQLMVLGDPQAPGQDAYMTIFNQDGSLSASCGNGTRCVAHVLAEQSGATEIRLATSAGPLVVQREGPLSYTVDMGPPRFSWREIPLSRDIADTRAVDLGRFGLPPAACASMGNPHAVFFVGDLDAHDLAAIGPALEHDPLFPERANISLAQVLSPDHARLKVWERGTGLTLACGTAACATLASGARLGLLRRKATISLPGGDLVIAWREDDGHILMTGPVELEFVRKIDPAIFVAEPARP